MIAVCTTSARQPLFAAQFALQYQHLSFCENRLPEFDLLWNCFLFMIEATNQFGLSCIARSLSKHIVFQVLIKEHDSQITTRNVLFC